MHLETDLVHSEPGRRVVRVQAHEGPRVLGSALGEAGSAEEAEDRAIERLLSRLQPSTPQPNQRDHGPSPREPVASRAGVAEPPPATGEARGPAGPEEVAEPPADPDDWSDELARIDQQLLRLGWEREQEGIYLQRAFGHPSRSRLTAYGDLKAYLSSLESLTEGADPGTAPVPIQRRQLLQQCDQLLQRLGWNASQGRRLLDQHFSVVSRQQLDEDQLLAFNMLLESEVLQLSQSETAAQ